MQGVEGKETALTVASSFYFTANTKGLCDNSINCSCYFNVCVCVLCFFKLILSCFKSGIFHIISSRWGSLFVWFFRYRVYYLHCRTWRLFQTMLRDEACWSAKHCGLKATCQSSCVDTLQGLRSPPLETCSLLFTPTSPQWWECKRKAESWPVWKVHPAQFWLEEVINRPLHDFGDFLRACFVSYLSQ